MHRIENGRNPRASSKQKSEGPELSRELFSEVSFIDKVSGCAPCWPGTHQVEHTGLELSEIRLCLPSAGDVKIPREHFSKKLGHL